MNAAIIAASERFGLQSVQIEPMTRMVGKHGEERHLGAAVAFAECMDRFQLGKEMRSENWKVVGGKPSEAVVFEKPAE